MQSLLLHRHFSDKHLHLIVFSNASDPLEPEGESTVSAKKWVSLNCKPPTEFVLFAMDQVTDSIKKSYGVIESEVREKLVHIGAQQIAFNVLKRSCTQTIAYMSALKILLEKDISEIWERNLGYLAKGDVSPVSQASTCSSVSLLASPSPPSPPSPLMRLGYAEYDIEGSPKTPDPRTERILKEMFIRNKAFAMNFLRSQCDPSENILKLVGVIRGEFGKEQTLPHFESTEIRSVAVDVVLRIYDQISESIRVMTNQATSDLRKIWEEAIDQ